MASIDMGDTKFGGTEIDGRGYGVMLASIICPGIALIFVALRWYCRTIITKTLRFDDWVALVTLFSNIAYSVVQGLATQPYIGVGNHQNDFDPKQVDSPYYKFVYIFDTFYILSLMGYKTAIVQLYIRVFGIRRHFKWACFILLFIVDGYLFGSLVAQLIGCIPPQKFWNKTLMGDCIDYLRFDIAYGCLNIITDFMITIFPLYEIWRLFMPIKEKVWASFIFCSAFLAFGTAVVSQTFRLQDLFSDDRTYRAAITFVWQTIEINTGLICSCTPALRPLWLRAVASISGTYRTGKSSESSQAGLVRKNMEKEMKGKPLDGDTLHDASSDPNDLEKSGNTGNIGVALGSAAGGDRSGAYPVHDEAYATPMPSDQQYYARPNTANTDQITDLPEPSGTRGRADQRAEPKRLSQAELERMVLEANVAKAKLERQAERSRQRHESDPPRDSEYSVPLPMLDPMPAPVSPVSSGLEVPHHHEYDHDHHHHHPSPPASPPASPQKKTKKKKSCDLEKGVGLRI